MNAISRPHRVTGIHWVRGELDQSLSRARTLIDHYAESGGDPLQLQQAYVEMHQVRGTAAMIECYGLAAVAAEMAAGLQDLIQQRVAEPEPLYGALLGATVQLADYIHALAESMPDCVLVMQPAINELRLARGQGVQTESELFVSQMQALGTALAPSADIAAPAAAAAQAQARRLLPLFQSSLVAWVRGGADAQTGAARVGKIAEQVGQHAVHPVIYQLWRTATAAIEAYLSRGVGNALELKRLFGRLAAQLKVLADVGEDAAAAQAGDLSLHLLFLVGRATSRGARVEALRSAFELDAYLPEPATLEQLRRRIHGTNTALLAKVATEIRSDFARVKDQIDLIVRTGDYTQSGAVTDGLQRIGGTLGALGLTRLQQIVAQLAKPLLTTGAEAAHWMDLATAILRIENDLEDALFRQMQQPEAKDGGLSDDIPAPRDLAEGRGALYREFLVNLARIKAAVDSYVKTGNDSDLPASVTLIGEIASGFDVLAQPHASEMCHRLGQFLAPPLHEQLRRDPEHADRFADAIAVVEYYIEALRAGLPMADHIIGDLAQSLQRLDAAITAMSALAGADATSVEAPSAVMEVATAVEVVDMPPVESAPAAAEEDPEIRDIFLEEAEEVRGNLRTAYAAWSRDPQNRDALTTLRRAFHTLKGSGRTVGATEIGEFGWALENMLNKALDGSTPIVPGMVDVVARGLDALPELIAAFRERRPVADAQTLAALLDDAREYAAGRTPAVAAEPDIAQVFREDVGEKLAAVDAWLSAQGSVAGVDADVVRAFHTLRGAARVVDAPAISDLAGAVEDHLDALTEAKLQLDESALSLLRDATAALQGWVAEVGTAAVARQDAAPLIARVEALQAVLPGGNTQISAERQLVEIFAGEAFELVSKIETQLRGWSQSPDNRRAAQELKALSHTLLGAAQMSACTAIGDVARALKRSFDGAATLGLEPQPAALTTLVEACEGLYQYLDRYRDGRLADDTQGWAERILALGWAQDEAELAPSVEAPAASVTEALVPTAAATSGLSETISLESFDAALEFDVAPPASTEDRLEFVTEPALAVAETLQAEVSGESLSLDSFDAELTFTPPAAVEAEKEVEPEPAPAFEALDVSSIEIGIVDPLPPPSSADVDSVAMASEPAPTATGIDFELAPAPAHDGDAAAPPAVDLASTLSFEAEHIVDMPPVASPPAPTSDAELLAIFHSEAEELIEGLDQSVAALERDPRQFVALAEIKRLLHTFKGSARVSGLQAVGEVAHRLESLFEQMEAGSVQPGTAFFSRVQNALDGLHLALDDLRRGVIPEPLQLLEELSQPLAEPQREVPPVVSMPVAAPSYTPSPAPAPTMLPDGFDLELAQTFSAEADELMEMLEEALPRWQALPADFSPARDMLRALHTYKGGARMAGLTTLGDAAHELESLIEGLEYAGEPDAGALKVVEGAVSELRRYTDRLQRGDYAALLSLGDEDGAAESDIISADDLLTTAASVIEEPVAPAGMWDPQLFWRPEDDAEALAAQRRETARVPVEALDRMLNEAGEISIYRSRMDEHNAAIQAQLDDMAQAIQRVRDQLRQLDIETEAQITARGLSANEPADRYAGEFDPLEMDRYTRMQELSRALNESVGDLGAVHASIDQLASEATTILLQQGRINTEVQQGLMRTLMVPFSRQIARLQRVVQQTAGENGKRVEIVFDGAEAELDRNVLERMTAPLEHLLRNAVIHGIELPSDREQAGKAISGRLTLTLWREGSQLHIELADDGRGLDLEAIRQAAVRRRLMPEDATVSDDEVAQFIFLPGFSTARQLTQDAGRGVGMDVVAAEVKQLGGTLELASETGKGARFKVRLPLTLAMSQSLLIGIGQELYAAPLPSVEGITRIARDQLDAYLAEGGEALEYGGQRYRVLHLADLIDQPRETATDSKTAHAILVRMPEGIGGTERHIAVIVDQLIGSRQIVSKAVGPQISSIPGVSGATILADGRVVLILDLAALVQDRTRRALRSQVALVRSREAPVEVRRDIIMVVDDSITIRRVTERLLTKHGYAVVTAKDGLDAMAQLATERPTAILLDIEMPRADGFEVATFVRNTSTIAQTPILMITSRSGDKHRERAAAIGVDRYLIKPYQEDQLLAELRGVLQERSA